MDKLNKIGKINICCPICDTNIEMVKGKFLNSFGQLFHYPKCWKVEVSKMRADSGV